VASVLTAGRRWSRCRLDVGGGAASTSGFTVVSCSAPAPPRPRSPLPPSGSSRPRPASAATRRRRRGVGPPPRLSSFALPPSSSPTAERLWEGGKNPNAGWWRWPSGTCLPPLLNPRRRRVEAESQVCPRLGPPGARGGAGLSLSRDRGPRGLGAGQKWLFLPPALARFARGRPAPRRACRPGGSAAPRAARAGATGPAAAGSGVLAG
jgi:hypothetical protein